VTKQNNNGLSICNDRTIPLPRQPDADAYYVHCSGGFRGAMVKQDVWMIEPILDGKLPCRKGYFSKAELQRFTASNRLAPIALQRISWINGRYHSSWSPIIPGRKNFLESPSELWSNLASNLASQRTGAELSGMSNPTQEKIAALLDDRTEDERLAESISLSLRSMDINVEQIAEFYHERLVDTLSAGELDGQRSASIGDQTLFADAHSFFMHLGAARDYLGAFVAARIGEDPRKIDSMGRLTHALRPHHFGTDGLLALLSSQKFIQPSPKNPSRWEVSGWLKEASDLRNEFMHHRPYGSRFIERFGYIAAILPEIGLYRYIRPILTSDGFQRDALDVVLYHYKNSTNLFQQMADISGHDISMLTITDEDIISANWTQR